MPRIPVMQSPRDMPLLCGFDSLASWEGRLPNEEPIVRFSHASEPRPLAQRILASVNLIQTGRRE